MGSATAVVVAVSTMAILDRTDFIGLPLFMISPPYFRFSKSFDASQLMHRSTTEPAASAMCCATDWSIDSTAKRLIDSPNSLPEWH